MNWLETLNSGTIFVCCSGERVEPDYKIHYSKSGVRSLEKDGTRNTWEEIQSHADSVDINIILARYNNGDESVLHKKAELHIDSTDLPTTLGEWHELMARANDVFKSMKPQDRDPYNQDVNQFVNAKVEEAKNNHVESKEGENNE